MSNFGSLLFYILIFLFSLLLIYFGYKRKRKFNFITCLGLLIPVIVAAIRFCGTDIVVTYNTFIRNKDAPFFALNKDNHLFTMGYFIIQKMSHLLGNHIVFFGICNLILVVLVYVVVTDHKVYVSVPFAMFVFFFMFYLPSYNIMRQYIAVAIVFFAYQYVFAHKPVSFFALVLLAATFHPTALVALPIYFFWNQQTDDLRRWDFICLFFIAGIVVLFSYQSIVSKLSSIDLFDRYIMYAETDASGQNRDIVVKIAILLLELVFSQKLIKHDKRNKLYIILSAFDVLIGFTGFVSPFIKRTSLYFALPQILILGEMPKIVKKDSKPLVIAMLSVFAFSYFVLTAYVLRQANLIPYKTSLGLFT